MSGLVFDDVANGDKLPQKIFGPLTSAHLMRWSAAMENWHKIHYDEKFAVTHDRLPGLLINGSLKQQFMMSFLKNWVGASGWIWKVDFQFRAMNIVGERLTLWGEVVGKTEAQGYGIVDVQLGIVNDSGKESTPGHAKVALPYRGGEPVPYPFQAPPL